jgi:death-on-curing protein
MILTSANLIEIHEVLADWFAGSEDPIAPPGIRDASLLASAAARPSQTVDKKDAYPTVYDKAGALFHSIINNHPVG